MSIDSCQSKKPADQCHMTLLRAQMQSLRMFIRHRAAQDGAQRNTQFNLLCIELTSVQFDMGNPFHRQLTAVKTRNPLTSFT